MVLVNEITWRSETMEKIGWSAMPNPSEPWNGFSIRKLEVCVKRILRAVDTGRKARAQTV